MKKKEILIIEDDYDLSALIIRHLRSADYNVLNVGDAIQGVQFARKEIPDLIVLDLMIPGGGGLVVLERLNQIPETQSIPVVVLTGVQDTETKKKVLRLGAVEYLEKPYNAQELLRSIKEHTAKGKDEEKTESMRTILIVDDDIDFTRMLVHDLQRADYKTFIAQDVDQGMRLVREKKPDLIILDLLLPGGGGFTLFENLKNLAYTQNLPVIVLTAIKDESYRQKMMEAGVEYYIEKPYNLNLLLDAIEVAI